MLFDVGFVLIQELTLCSSPHTALATLASRGRIEAVIHYYHIIHTHSHPVYELKSS